MTISTLLGFIEDIVISVVVFLVVSLRNAAGTVFQGRANSANDFKSIFLFFNFVLYDIVKIIYLVIMNKSTYFWDLTWSNAECQPWFPDEQVVRFLSRYVCKKFGFDDSDVNYFTTNSCPSGLDIGCGKGRHAIAFAQLGIDSYGCDISPVAISFCNSWATSKKLNVKFDICFNTLPYQSNKFDFIVCHAVLDHMLWADRLKMICEIDRVLKDQGTLFISLITTNDNSYSKGRFLEHDTWLIEEGNEKSLPQAFFDESRIEKEFEGWKILTLEKIDTISLRGRSLIGTDKHHALNSRFYLTLQRENNKVTSLS